ncbi:MAG: serine hydrolase domain-containing protein [Promethearchaeota archaeon]
MNLTIRNKKIIIGLIIIACVISAGITVILIITVLPPTQESFESKIQKLMAEYEIPSLAAGIIINDSIVWARGFGEQPDLDTVYMIGSITKTFTATAILQLNESNLLNLDGDINNYLPFEVRHPNYPNIPITTRMLLTHNAGLQTNLFWSLEYYFDNQTIDWINENLDLGGEIIKWDDRPSLEEFLNGSLNPNGLYYDHYNWHWRPGSEFHYSNAGFQLLGYLIEKVTNQTWIEYIQENIFNPLNMTSSGFEYADFAEKNAIPYEWKDNGNFEYPLYNINVTGAGCLRSTIPDMAKYLISYMNQGEYNGTQLINPESVELIHSNHVSLTGTSVEGFNWEGYGLGWFLYSENFKGHGGATPGFSSNMYFKKDNEGTFGVILMFNRGSALIYDEKLINSFIPSINQLILERAEFLFQQAH